MHKKKNMNIIINDDYNFNNIKILRFLILKPDKILDNLYL